MQTHSTAAAEESYTPPPKPMTREYRAPRHEGPATSRLLWIGVGIVVGVMLLKQLPQARRYLRLETM